MKNLHSSMVRLETCKGGSGGFIIKIIYIPVWLDQKPDWIAKKIAERPNLHSSMVRLETNILKIHIWRFFKFTFQYGQIRNIKSNLLLKQIIIIYIPVWLDQKLVSIAQMVSIAQNLHSSMVRLETF